MRPFRKVKDPIQQRINEDIYNKLETLLREKTTPEAPTVDDPEVVLYETAGVTRMELRCYVNVPEGASPALYFVRLHTGDERRAVYPGTSAEFSIADLPIVPTLYISAAYKTEDGKVSKWSEETAVATEGKSVGSMPPENLSVTLAEHGILLDWDASPDADVVGYNIYRGTDTTFANATLIRSGHRSTAYVDQEVTQLSDYYYWVTAVNSSGIESEEAGPVGPQQRTTVAHLSVIEGSGQDIATITDCETTTGWSIVSGAGVTISASTLAYEGRYSIKVYIPASTTARVRFTPTSTLDFTARDILFWWIRRSNGRNKATYTVYINDTVNGESSIEKARPYNADIWFRHSWITDGTDASIDRIDFEFTSTAAGATVFYLDLIQYAASTPPTRVTAAFPGGTVNIYPPICPANGPFPLKDSAVYTYGTGTSTVTVPDGEIWHLDVVKAGTYAYLQVNGNAITTADEDTYLNGCWLAPGDDLTFVTGESTLRVLISKYEAVDYAVPIPGATLVDATTSYTVPTGSFLELTRIDGLALSDLQRYYPSLAVWRNLIAAGLNEVPPRIVFDEDESIRGSGTLYLFGILWRLKED
jgi:hypothetical protein